MNGEHDISDELLKIVELAISRNENWMVYNNSIYFIRKDDVFFFKEKDAAEEFATNNISDHDRFNIIYVQSVEDVLRQIPYYERLTVDPDANALYNRDGNAFTNTLIDHFEQEQLLNNSKNKIMNEKNFEYLKDNLKYHGFGDALNGELESNLKRGEAEFTLPFKTEVNKREIEATLYLKKSDTTDMYFFNKYDTRLQNEKDETLAQTFYINKGQGVTLKEAYNLLNGRAVHKELTDKNDQKYQAWIQLDFSTKDKNGNFERKQYHQNYGYDLKEALSYYPIKEMMKDDDKKSLLRSLEKGNVQMVTIETPGKDIKVFIEANPQYKTITVYNNKMQRLDQDKRQELMQKPELGNEKGKDKEQSKDKNKEQSKGLDGAGDEKKKPAKGQKNNGEDNGLVTKKRTNGNKKGLGV